MSAGLHLNLDNAWPNDALGLPSLDLQAWGRQLRFSAPPRLIETFYREIHERLPAFLLFGSGDFHHLTGLWLRRLSGPAVVVSLDNHPDWDVRPPKWCCGGWVNRALELPNVRQVSVWGCGNFECWWPGQIFGNRRAERSGKLEVHPWADDRSPKDRQRRGAMARSDWRARFEAYASNLGDTNVYVTIDLDCLRKEDAITNWENGHFETVDLIWALKILRANCRIVAGDICGAYSKPHYARWKQRFAAEFDHPKLTLPEVDEIKQTNLRALEKLWPALLK